MIAHSHFETTVQDVQDPYPSFGEPQLSDIPLPKRFLGKSMTNSHDSLPLSSTNFGSAAPSHVSADHTFADGSSFDDSFVEEHASQEVASQLDCATLMVKNVPVYYTKEMFQQELDQTKFRSLYVSVRIPKRRGGKCNRGYVFVHFVSCEAASMFLQEWRGRRLLLYSDGGNTRHRPLAISKAHREGFEDYEDNDAPSTMPQSAGNMSSQGMSSYDEWARNLRGNGRQQFSLVGDFAGYPDRDPVGNFDGYPDRDPVGDFAGYSDRDPYYQYTSSFATYR
eukprot:TRINITY_DN6410_c0_g1_i1.p1 TRINITY_DN6410_c0_g1~~TRINITY_DN6410_c0_g1_i1.p1  ORF type:complete len:280 (-),score=32.87 TRINITY_DN6410_c0_g1_i1:354-1193(-)